MAKKHIQEGTPMPPAADMWFRLKQNKAAMFGLVVVIFLIVAAIVAQFAIDYSDVVEPNADECLQARPGSISLEQMTKAGICLSVLCTEQNTV